MSMLERIARYNQSTRSRLEIPRLHIKPKPARISDDGEDRSQFSRRRDIMNQVEDPKENKLGFLGDIDAI